MKDWKNTKQSVAVTLGTTSGKMTTENREQMDYYATDPKAVRLLLELEKFEGKIWEAACGEGSLSEEMKRLGYEVFSTDIINRGYGDKFMDFLWFDNSEPIDMNIITNPPYRYANQFIIRAMSIIQEGKKLALFLPIRYLEGIERKEIFRQYPPKMVYVSSSRLKCALNGEFEKINSSALGFAWFVWQKGYDGETILRWFN